MDFAQIEDSKENVQPLASGRDAKMLAQQLKGLKQQPTSDTAAIFKEACKNWEEQLESYSGDDLLQVWDDYIRWAQQNATSDKLMAQIVPLLQRCTRHFQKHDQYKQDPRYLRIWIKYIDTVKDPSDVFAFLEANDIGTSLALFYTSWALAMELKKGMYAEAYAKLEEGMNKKAEPEEKLRLALKQFQHRMNQRTMEAMTKTAEPAEASDGREFGDQLSKGRRVVKQAPPPGSTQGVSRRGAAGAQRAAPARGGAGAPVAAANNKAGFSIFVDSGEGGGGGGGAEGGGWEVLPGEAEKSKENTRKPTQWTKEAAGTIPQRRKPAGGVGAPAAAAPKAGVDFELFVDEGLEAPEQREGERKPIRLQLEGEEGRRRDREAKQRQDAPLEFLSEAAQQHQGAGAELELEGAGRGLGLRERAEPSLPGFRQPPSQRIAPSEGGEATGAKPQPRKGAGAGGKGRTKSEDGTGVAGYCRAMLVTAEGEELSIEEARTIARYGEQHWDGTFDFHAAPQPQPQPAAAAEESDGDVEMAVEGSPAPTKPLSMTEVFESVGRPSNYPDFTQPSPTLSSLAPKASSLTEQPKSAPAAEKTPVGRTGSAHSEEADGNTPTKFGGNDLSAISKGTASFLANSSRHTLCPAHDSNFTLHDPTATAPLHANDENAPPVQQLTFSAEPLAGCFSPAGGRAGDFFMAAAAAVSPTVNTRNAQNEILNLMPSPTQTARSFRAPTHQQRQLDDHDGELLVTDDAPEALVAKPKTTTTTPLAAGALRAASPTVNTRAAQEQVFDLMPSPTATFQFVAQGAAFGSPCVASTAAPSVGAVGGFEIREDTEQGGFMIREDTACIIDPQPAATGGGGGFVIREDTNCAPGGFKVREDTACAELVQAAAGVAQVEEKAEAESMGGGGAFVVCEDPSSMAFKPVEDDGGLAFAGTDDGVAPAPIAPIAVFNDENQQPRAAPSRKGSAFADCKRKGLRVLDNDDNVAHENEDPDAATEQEKTDADPLPPVEAEERTSAEADDGGGRMCGVFGELRGIGVGELSRIGESSVVGAEAEDQSSSSVVRDDDKNAGAEDSNAGDDEQAIVKVDPTEGAGPEETAEAEPEGRRVRARSAVCYKEPPINVKCRQGANPWGLSSSLNSSGEKSLNASTDGAQAAEEKAAGAGAVGVVLGCGGQPVHPLSEEHGAALADAARKLLQAQTNVEYERRGGEEGVAVRVGSKLELWGMLFHTEAVLGKGGWSTVYKLRRVRVEQGALDDLDTQSLSALKVLTHASAWELYVSSRIHREVSAAARASLLELRCGLELPDTTLLLAEYAHQHSLQDLINAYRRSGKKMDEHVVVFFAIEILRVVSELHGIGVLHGDLKPDNILLRDDDPSAHADWEYAPHNGFSSKGVMLIDYGCAIDRRLYAEGVAFHGRSRTSSFECPEMQAGEAWAEQVDLFAVAGVVHCLLHAEYMELAPAPQQPAALMPKLPLKRYWQVEMWTALFDSLINSCARGSPPDLRAARQGLEQFFEGKGASKRQGMRMALIKQSILLDQYAA